jgi:hypothetical protein
MEGIASEKEVLSSLFLGQIETYQGLMGEFGHSDSLVSSFVSNSASTHFARKGKTESAPADPVEIGD